MPRTKGVKMDIKYVPGCKNKWIIGGGGGVVKPQNIKPIIAIVIHHTGTFSEQSTIGWFTESTQDGSNPNSSAHFLIGKDGSIWQFVGEGERAWHAGVSKMTIGGVEYSSWNRFSIGIELTGDGNVKPYTADQYKSLTDLLLLEVVLFNVKREFLVGHSHIAPGRKTDPGKYFDWDRVLGDVYGTGE
jgi:N-acetyl-anhydromuramyl-L-alanine amidase AmpD